MADEQARPVFGYTLFDSDAPMAHAAHLARQVTHSPSPHVCRSSRQKTHKDDSTKVKRSNNDDINLYAMRYRAGHLTPLKRVPPNDQTESEIYYTLMEYCKLMIPPSMEALLNWMGGLVTLRNMERTKT